MGDYFVRVYDIFYGTIMSSLSKNECVCIKNYYCKLSYKSDSYYSRIIPDSFSHLFFQKLFWHNVLKPTCKAIKVCKVKSQSRAAYQTLHRFQLSLFTAEG